MQRTMAQEGRSSDSVAILKMYAERERQLRMMYTETLCRDLRYDQPPDEEAPLDLPQTTCIIIGPIRQLFW